MQDMSGNMNHMGNTTNNINWSWQLLIAGIIIIDFQATMGSGGDLLFAQGWFDGNPQIENLLNQSFKRFLVSIVTPPLRIKNPLEAGPHIKNPQKHLDLTYEGFRVGLVIPFPRI